MTLCLHCSTLTYHPGVFTQVLLVRNIVANIVIQALEMNEKSHHSFIFTGTQLFFPHLVFDKLLTTGSRFLAHTSLIINFLSTPDSPSMGGHGVHEEVVCVARLLVQAVQLLSAQERPVG